MTVPTGYSILESGTVCQEHVFNKPMVYDVEYVKNRYDRYDTCESLSRLRCEMILRECSLFNQFRLLDFGYGNGAFLKMASRLMWTPLCHGFDISGYPIPGMCQEAGYDEPFDVVTMFDSLEHLWPQRIASVLSGIQAAYLVVSLPWSHHRALGWDWFMGWKHRRPDEHFFHFDAVSLPMFLSDYGWKLTFLGNPEDSIRTPVDGLPNILSAVFKHENRNC